MVVKGFYISPILGWLVGFGFAAALVQPPFPSKFWLWQFILGILMLVLSRWLGSKFSKR